MALHTLGCKLNYSETSSIAEDFRKRGYEIVDLGEPTDIIVINTCTVTEQADTECRKIIRRGLKAAPDARVVVTGCYAQLKPEEIASFDGVTAVVGTAGKSHIAAHAEQYLEATAPIVDVQDLDDDTSFVGSSTAEGDSRSRAFLKLQDGCDYSCSFCTIPLARGPARAMAFPDVIPAIRDLSQQGYTEVVLSGINLGEYHAPTGERFVDVVRTVASEALPLRVRVSSIEPNTLTTAIIDIIASSPVFAKHLHIPLQSGSSEILRKMRRRYQPEHYREIVEYVRHTMSDAGIGIDVIVGFPGETDELFEESYRFLESVPWSYLHVFTYSERVNTPAAAYPGRVPVDVRRARTARLRALSDRRRSQHAASFVGNNVVIVPESYDAATGRWVGWSSEYVRVHMSGPELLVRGAHVAQIVSPLQDHPTEVLATWQGLSAPSHTT